MTIPYGRQEITAADIKAVVEVLQSDYLTQGPMVPIFERTVAEYCGVATATAVNSATSALHIACMALGVGVGDLVWTSPITFVASANCACYCGADVDFVDIHNITFMGMPIEGYKAYNQFKDKMSDMGIDVEKMLDDACVGLISDSFIKECEDKFAKINS